MLAWLIYTCNEKPPSQAHCLLSAGEGSGAKAQPAVVLRLLVFQTWEILAKISWYRIGDDVHRVSALARPPRLQVPL